jgi:hypothetical protein
MKQKEKHLECVAFVDLRKHYCPVLEDKNRGVG